MDTKQLADDINKMKRLGLKNYFMIAYDAGLKKYNSKEFKMLLTQMLIDEGAEDLQSLNESTIIFSTINSHNCSYWTQLIHELFHQDDNYEKHLFFTIAEIKKEAVTYRPLLAGKQDNTLNTNYIETVEKLRNPDL